jgi:protein-S-isoprenylcysteine O-methyltransferase
VNRLASILGIFFVLSEIALSVFKRAQRGARVADRGSLSLIWIVIGISVFCAFYVSFAAPEAAFGAWRAAARIMGIVLFVSGLALRWFAIVYLGRFFTVNVAIASDHELIDTGPYRFIRHPSYTGALMAFLGLGLCIGNWLSLGILLAPILLVFLHRVRIEEAALLQGLGEQYRGYRNRTKRLIPGIY